MTEHVTIRPKILYVGTPVMLIATLNLDGSANLAPASSYWALEQLLIIGLEDGGQTIDNVRRTGELTVNFPGPTLWPAIEAIGDTTGKSPVPDAKQPRYTHVADKFAVAGLTQGQSEVVAPPVVAECRLQLEATVERITDGVGPYSIVEALVQRVHADPQIVIPGTEHIDPRTWEPTIYSFRHYFGLGTEHGNRPGTDVPQD